MKIISIQKKLTLLSARLVFGAISFFLLSLVVLSIYNGNRIFNNIETQTTENLISNGHLLVSNHSIALRSMVLEHAFSEVRELVTSTVEMNTDIVRGAFIDKNKQPWVLGDSENPQGKEKIILDDDQGFHWSATVSRTSHRRITENGNEFIVFAAPVMEDNERLGTIVYKFSTSYMKNEIAASKKTYFIEAMIFAVAMLFIAGLFFAVAFQATRRQAESIIQPLNELTHAATVISEGDYGLPVQTCSNDEVGVLAQSFEKMRQTIKKYTDRLEQIVEERTKELQKTNEALKDAETRMRSLLDNSPDFILNVDQNLVIQYSNSVTEKITGKNLIGKSILDFVLPEDRENYRNTIVRVLNTGKNEVLITQIYTPGEKYRWLQNRFVAIQGSGLEKGVMLIATDITNSKLSAIKLEQANKQMIEAAHQAGMAQIASETIHNIGNILTSVKVSAHVIESVVHGSIIRGFKKANALLLKNINMLDSFILEDPKGKQLMKYYLQIEKVMIKENREISEHVNRLSEKIDSIAEVISAQQGYTGFQMLNERYPIAEIIEDALTILQYESLPNYNITIYKNFKDIPDMPIQKTKLVHILINLFRNARDAMLDTPVDKRFIKIYTYSVDQAVYIKVTDNGYGIAKENLNKIFNHGFSTKKTGHGFGLHSSANYMAEMGGNMWVESDGPGKGATFILEFKLT